MKIMFFARMKQLAGRGEADVDIPADVKTISALIDFLKSGDEGLAQAFADMRIVRAAINRKHVQLDALIEGAEEIAFFPPVTGG
jgi:sulfur-carrier protein